MNDSKDDKQDCVNQQETRSPNRDPGLSSGAPTNNNGHATNERDRGGMKLRLKPMETAPSLPEKSKPTGGIQGSPPDQRPQPGRKEFQRMLSGTVSTPNACWFSILMERRTGLNMTVTI